MDTNKIVHKRPSEEVRENEVAEKDKQLMTEQEKELARKQVWLKKLV